MHKSALLMPHCQIITRIIVYASMTKRHLVSDVSLHTVQHSAGVQWFYVGMHKIAYMDRKC